ncbi:MAG: SDR family NAD(P)-dependent oxidoreductase [Pseudomonadota bacterium]
MAQLFIFGLGYSAARIAASARAQGWQVSATGSAGDMAFADDARVRPALAAASHVLSSVPPSEESGDPVLAAYGTALAGKRVAYLSATGVYGDAGGAWVDESSPVGTGRRTARAAADAQWLALGAHVLRLPGIYGPGRSVFERLTDGRAQRIYAPGQVFSRVHVEDIATGTMLALTVDAPAGAYNLADDLPCSQNAVIEHACRLSGLPLPPLQTLEQAALSPMARRFYSENRRVANGKAKRLLGWQPRYPTYREGLASLLTGT